MAAAVVLPIVGVVAWIIASKPEIVPVDAKMCPIGRGAITEYAVVILDTSEPVIGGNAEEIARRILTIGDGLRQYGKLLIFDAHDTSKPIVALCRPQSEAECDRATAPGACAGVAAQYDRTFNTPVTAALSAFLGAQVKQDASPIMEAVMDISLLTEYEGHQGQRSLHLVSDMLQHTPGVYSHHRVVPEGEFAAVAHVPFVRDHTPQLEDATVEILYILRRQYRKNQTANHRSFWTAYFEASGAQAVAIENLKFVGGDTTSTRPHSPVSGREGPSEEAMPSRDDSTGDAEKMSPPSAVPMVVVTEPEDASVDVEGFDFRPDQSGPIRLLPGDYTITVTAPWYEPKTLVVSHEAEAKAIRVSLAQSVAGKLQSALERNLSPVARTEDGWTDIHYAAYLDLPAQIDELVEQGARVDVPVSGDAEAIGDDVLAVLEQLGHQSPLRGRGRLPLHYAAAANSTAASERLIQHGADVNARDKVGLTPLHAAARNDSEAVARVLLRDGADKNVRATSRRITPLHTAAAVNAERVAELLVIRGANIHARTSDRLTPLHWAAARDSIAVAELLIASGAKVNARGIERITPLGLARDRGASSTLIEILRRRGGR